MFERFTERARQVVVLAQDEARALRHNYIGTEHLLLGLLREEEGIGAQVLRGFGIEIDAVRALIRSRIGEGDNDPAGQIPFTAHAKQTLELSLREALSLGHNSIGTEHLLLGFVRRDEGVGVDILEQLGASPAAIRDEVMRRFSGPGLYSTNPRRLPGKKHRRVPPVALLVTGWLLFGAALGVGVLIGWAIWG